MKEFILMVLIIAIAWGVVEILTGLMVFLASWFFFGGKEGPPNPRPTPKPLRRLCLQKKMERVKSYYFKKCGIRLEISIQSDLEGWFVQMGDEGWDELLVEVEGCDLDEVFNQCVTDLLNMEETNEN